MINKEVLVKKIEILPPSLLQEVADYIDFIKYKKYKNNIENDETFLLSEKALAKDWLKPEEDEVWENL